MQRKIRATIAPAVLGCLAVSAGCTLNAAEPAPLSGSGGAVANGGAVNTGGLVNSGGAANSGGASTGGTVNAGGSTASGGSGGNPLGRARCRAPAGVSAAPKSTQQTLDLLNALPKPTSVACFLESLERPLIAYATSSVFSAQPALSAESPRVFIKLGQLWLSVVMDGESSYLMEFGELLLSDPNRSIKGELQLPLAAPVGPSAPYDRVAFSEGTVCRFCHTEERRVEGSEYVNAFESIAFKPRAETRVGIESLRNAAAACNWQAEPHRCEMFSAVFDGGVVIEQAFPDAMPTFF